jgi:thymidylate synthase (FAD)
VPRTPASQVRQLQVQLVARTEFLPPADVPWSTDAEGGQALAEFAGRACYQSWSKPRPSTATNAAFLRHVLQVGHLSVLEHGTATLYLRGVSRTVAHEVLRHRHFSTSELSPRHVPDDGAPVVLPAVVAQDPAAAELFLRAATVARAAHDELLAALEASRGGGAAPAGPELEAETLRHKQARQAALALLPGTTETQLVVTGNYRAWRHFVAARATDLVDLEVRALAVACLRELRSAAPHVFSDFEVGELADGTEVASSPYVTEA